MCQSGKTTGKFMLRSLLLISVFIVLGVMTSMLFVSDVSGQEKAYNVRGKVINSISKKPVAGATVEISIADKASTAPVVTDANGNFEFPDLGTLEPPYRLDVTKRKYKPKTVQPVDSGANITIDLEPGNIQKPVKPRVYSGPRSVRVGWDANPEYNIAGYNVYRRTVDANGNALTAWTRLNNPG
ncbi:MAG: carboxypeptidase-like regulatory domain-containing protein, partial [Candidatus Hydrogenedens sp.]|nr:carboxypeptidase-like regulatory domain-containing protein [Candidatus Hydrogenedens sp.]